ncbi:MAG: M14 family metallopeptidase, partial [Allomuricauda sp.]
SGHWQIIDSSAVFKKDSIVTIKLDLNKEPITVAAQEIQSSKDVSDWYMPFVTDISYVQKNTLGKSTLGRDLVVLDINKPSSQKKALVVLITRQHPPEVTGFYAFQSFLETILDNSELANAFLDRYRVLAFPLMNPDGVDLGHWRHNAGGVDTNRDWSKYRQPEVRHTVDYIHSIMKNEDLELVLGLDFHSTWYDVFYTNTEREGTTMPQFVDDWFGALENNIEGYKVNEQAGNSKKPVSKGWFLYGHNAVGITYEIGDATPKQHIEKFGTVSSREMMKLLINQ